MKGIGMVSLNGFQKRKLKSIAHHIKPVVQIGHKGITDNLITAIDKALFDHELIKIKFLDFKKEKMDVSKVIEEKTGSKNVGIIGNMMILFRQNSEVQNRKIEL